jgi:hypothetical protein
LPVDLRRRFGQKRQTTQMFDDSVQKNYRPCMSCRDSPLGLRLLCPERGEVLSFFLGRCQRKMDGKATSGEARA